MVFICAVISLLLNYLAPAIVALDLEPGHWCSLADVAVPELLAVGAVENVLVVVENVFLRWCNRDDGKVFVHGSLDSLKGGRGRQLILHELQLGRVIGVILRCS